MKNNKPTISIIAAVSENLALGKDNKLLWHIPEDLKHFKKITQNHPVIMGEKTFYSIGQPLPNRLNIVLSKNKNLKLKDCVVTDSIEDAIFIASDDDQKEIFFIGGGSIYHQSLPLTNKLYLTLVKGNFEADTFFPKFRKEFKIIDIQKSGNENYKFDFTVWERK